MKNAFLLLAALTFFSFENHAQTTVTDIDGNVYNTVTIGTQKWMKENLKTTKFNDGAIIPLVTGDTWGTLSTPAYCYYNNDAAAYAPTYGALYNWFATNAGNLCPTGWDMPTDDDWTVLGNFLNGDSVAGGKMKEAGLAHWISPNTGATNSSDFTALPGGYRDVNNAFSSNTSNGRFWSSSEINTDIAWARTLFYDSYDLNKSVRDKNFGLSVRCFCAAVNINEAGIGDKFQLYPNPATERVSVVCDQGQPVTLQVFNMMGVCVFQDVFAGGTIDLDLVPYPKGTYVIRLTGAGWTTSQKLTRE